MHALCWQYDIMMYVVGSMNCGVRPKLFGDAKACKLSGKKSGKQDAVHLARDGKKSEAAGTYKEQVRARLDVSGQDERSSPQHVAAQLQQLSCCNFFPQITCQACDGCAFVFCGFPTN
jgi:hypothetical protein